MKTIYQCEVCGNQYDTDATAYACENQVLPPPKYKEGDKVKLEDRYDGIIEVTIMRYEGIRRGGKVKHQHSYYINPGVQFAARDPSVSIINEDWVHDPESDNND